MRNVSQGQFRRSEFNLAYFNPLVIVEGLAVYMNSCPVLRNLSGGFILLDKVKGLFLPPLHHCIH